MYKDIDFDENNPSKDNIEYVLSKLLYCLTSAKYFNDYKEYRSKISKISDELNLIIDKFINTSDLLKVTYDMLDNIAIEIDYLDHETISKDGFYLEMANAWVSILIRYYDILKS